MVENSATKWLLKGVAEAAACIVAAAAVAVPLTILSHRASERFSRQLSQSSPSDHDRRTSPDTSSTQ